MPTSYTLEDIISAYEKKQKGIIQAVIQQIMQLFDKAANEAAFLAVKRKLVNNRFLPKDIRESIDTIATTINTETEKLIINGIKKAWAISNEKNDIIIKTQASGSGNRPPRTPKTTTVNPVPGGDDMFNPNTSALEAFLKRKDTGGTNAGLNLSKRVFKLSNQFKKAINDALIEGLKDGTSARELSKQVRQYLRNPTKVANPGQGVYKSPVKNALRLTRNEINLAYANADYNRWQQLWFVIAIEIRLSNRHPKYDMCDNLKGQYPKTFHFTLWHPNCLCIAIPVLAPQEVRDAMLDYQLGLTDTPHDVPYLKNIPAAATSWISDNAARIQGWKNTPYWVASNPDFVDDLLN